MTTRLIRIGKNHEMQPALSRSTAGAAHAARPVVLPRMGRAAPEFDATAERWVVPPSGTKPDAAAPAEPGRSNPRTNTRLFATPRPAAKPHPAAGHFRAAFIDFLITMLGLTTFAGIAAFLWVLA